MSLDNAMKQWAPGTGFLQNAAGIDVQLMKLTDIAVTLESEIETFATRPAYKECANRCSKIDKGNCWVNITFRNTSSIHGACQPSPQKIKEGNGWVTMPFATRPARPCSQIPARSRDETYHQCRTRLHRACNPNPPIDDSESAESLETSSLC